MLEKGTHRFTKLIVIVLCWLIAFYVALIVMRDSETSLEPSRPAVPPVKQRGVCNSPACIALAHQLHNWRDVSVDPCEDFYKAVCGKYNEHSLYRGGARLLRNTYVLQQLVQDFLENDAPTKSESENAMSVYYKKCKEEENGNKTETDMRQKKEILELIQKIGPCPLLYEDWDESKFDLNDMLTNMAKLGVTNFGLFEIRPIVNPYVRIANSFPYSGGRDPIIEMFGKIAMANGVKIDNITKDGLDVMELLMNLATLYQSEVEDGEVSLSELQDTVPSVDFERIMRGFMSENQKKKVWETVKDRTYAYKMQYFANRTNNIETIIQNTPKRTLANFLIFHFILGTFDPPRRPSGYGSTNSCGVRVHEEFPLASLRVFVRNYYNRENLNAASEIVEDIQSGMIELFQKSTWLSGDTKKDALKKVEMMKKMIGYPREMDAPGMLDQFYETLDLLESDSYLMARLKMRRFNMQLHFDHVASLLPLKSNVFYAESSALYRPYFNLLTLNVLFLDDPLFDSTYPSYVRIASIGSVVGHEMGHGFDTNGKELDGDGEAADWFTQENRVEYDHRAQCLIDQFNNYDDPRFGRNNWCGYPHPVPLALQLQQVHPTNSFRVNGPFSNMKQFAEAFNCPVGSPMNPRKKCELF